MRVKKREEMDPTKTHRLLGKIFLRWILMTPLNDAANSTLLLPGEWSCLCRDTETTMLVKVVSKEQ